MNPTHVLECNTYECGMNDDMCVYDMMCMILYTYVCVYICMCVYDMIYASMTTERKMITGSMHLPAGKS